MSYVKPYTLMNNRKLRTERKQRGWTQARLAKALGVTTRTVMRWEQGLALPRLNHRMQLGTLFGKTAEELGLFWNIEENESSDPAPATSSLIAYQIMPEGTGQASLQVDATIRQTLGKSGCLLGRVGLLMQVKERLLDVGSLPFIALYGLSGIGKTTLAAALATDPQIQAHFADGILWAPLGPQPHMLSQLMRWGMQLGVTLRNVENTESLQAWRQALQAAIGTRQMLLILDDVWTAEDALTLQVGGPQCTHLLTTHQSQVAFTCAQQHAIAVPQLEEADGLALLARFVPLFIQQDPQGAQSLVQVLGCLPLALTLMGKYLASSALTDHPWPLRAALMLLHATQDQLRLSTPTTSGQRYANLAEMMPFSLCTTIAICTQQLSQEGQATLSTLACFPPKPHSFSEEAALAMTQQSREIVDALCDAGLLESWGAGRYSLHQAIAHYARIRAKPY